MIDPITLAMLPRDQPLAAFGNSSGFTCVICGCTQEPHYWRVKLPEAAGKACVGCAGDHGFTVK